MLFPLFRCHCQELGAKWRTVDGRAYIIYDRFMEFVRIDFLFFWVYNTLDMTLKEGQPWTLAVVAIYLVEVAPQRPW